MISFKKARIGKRISDPKLGDGKITEIRNIPRGVEIEVGFPCGVTISFIRTVSKNGDVNIVTTRSHIIKEKNQETPILNPDAEKISTLQGEKLISAPQERKWSDTGKEIVSFLSKPDFMPSDHLREIVIRTSRTTNNSKGGACKTCKKEHYVLFIFRNTNFGTIEICEKCKNWLLEKFFNRLDAHPRAVLAGGFGAGKK